MRNAVTLIVVAAMAAVTTWALTDRGVEAQTAPLAEKTLEERRSEFYDIIIPQHEAMLQAIKMLSERTKQGDYAGGRAIAPWFLDIAQRFLAIEPEAQDIAAQSQLESDTCMWLSLRVSTNGAWLAAHMTRNTPYKDNLTEVCLKMAATSVAINEEAISVIRQGR